jgi:hypothetical protein
VDLQRKCQARDDAGNLAHQVAAGQGLEYQRRNQALTEERDIFGLASMELFFLPDLSLRRKAARVPCKWYVARLRRAPRRRRLRRGGRREPDPAASPAVGSAHRQTKSGAGIRPVDSSMPRARRTKSGVEVGLVNAVSATHSVTAWARKWRTQKLTALARYRGGGGFGVALCASSRRVVRNSAITVKLERRQGRMTPATGTRCAGRSAQVAAHPDDAVEGRVDERARVEAMRGEWMFGMYCGQWLGR